MQAQLVTDGGRGSGVNPFGTDFPFVAPSDDIRHLFCDAQLLLDADVTPPLYLTWVHGFTQYLTGDADAGSLSSSCGSYAASHAADVVVQDAAGHVVLDTTQLAEEAYRTTAFGPRRRLHEWRAAQATLQLVQHTGWAEQLGFDLPDDTFCPVLAELDPRVYLRQPPRVDALTAGIRLTGNLRLEAGYNIRLEVDDESSDAGQLRAGRTVVLSAQPGDGLGRYPGCETPELLVRQINSVKPNSAGGFLLAAADCYAVRQPTVVAAWPTTVTVQPATLQLVNDCGPCCDCQDFINVYTAVQRVWSRFKALGRRAEQARDTLRDSIARWEAQRDCRNSRLVRVTAVAFATRYLELAASICNNTETCIYDVELQIAVQTHGDGDYTTTLVPCTGFISTVDGSTIPYTPGGSHPTYLARFDTLRPGASGRVRFRLFVSPAPLDGTSFTLTATARHAAGVWPTAESPASSETHISIKTC